MSTSDKIQSIIEMLFTWGMEGIDEKDTEPKDCLLYTSPSPRDATLSRMPSSA